MPSPSQLSNQLSDLEAQRRQQEAQANSYIRPRRFGVAGEVQRQQGQVQQQETARQNIQVIQEQEQQVKSTKAQQDQARAYLNDYERAYQKANSPNPQAFPLENDRQRQLFYEFSTNNKVNELQTSQEKKFQASGLTPVYQDGKLVGFQDNVRQQSIELKAVPQVAQQSPEASKRYESAGVISRVPSESFDTSSPLAPQNAGRTTERLVSSNSQQNINNTSSTNNNVSSSRTSSRYDNNINSTNTMSIPRSKTSPLLESQGRGEKVKEYGTAYAQRIKSDLLYPVQSIPNFLKSAATVGAGVALGAVSPIALTVATGGFIAYGGYQVIKNKGSPESLADLSLAVAPIAISKGLRLLREPVPIKIEPRVEPTVKFKANQILVQQGERNVLANEFTITAVKPERQAFVTNRLDIFKSNLAGVSLPEGTTTQTATFDQLLLKYPQGKVITYEPASYAVGKTEPFITKQGKVVAPLNRDSQGVAIFIASGTKSRTNPLTVARLEGQMFSGSKTLDSINRNKLDVNTKEGLKSIESLSRKQTVTKRNVPNNVGNPLEITSTTTTRKRFTKGTLLEKGEVIVTDLIKLPKTTKTIEVLPYGKRKQIGDITAISENKLSAKFERDYGLTEVEILSERMGVVDVTKPTSKSKGTLITGTTRRYTYNIESESEGVNFVKGQKKSKTTTTEQVLNQQTLKSLIGGAGLKLAKSTSTRKAIPGSNLGSTSALSSELQRIGNLPLIVGGSGKGASQYANKGASAEAEFVLISNPNRTKEETKLNNRLNIRSESKTQLRELPRESVREIIEEIARTQERQMTRQSTRQATRQQTRQVTRQSSSSSLFPLGISYTSNPFPLRKSQRLKGDKNKSLPGYLTFEIKGGKKEFLPGIRTRGEALQVGAKDVLGNLRATFGIQKTSKLVSGQDNNYRVSDKLFRQYQIKKGQRQPLQNTFIQRTRKEGGAIGGRLGSRTEVSAIQTARRMKLTL